MNNKKALERYQKIRKRKDIIALIFFLISLTVLFIIGLS